MKKSVVVVSFFVFDRLRIGAGACGERRGKGGNVRRCGGRLHRSAGLGGGTKDAV